MNSIILFIKLMDATFINQDVEILSRHFRVKLFRYIPGNGMRTLFSNIQMTGWLILNLIRAKAVYIWFADYHSFLPILMAKLFGKKSILVLGGYDVAKIPELGYGSFIYPVRAFATKFSMKYASICLSVSNYVEKEAKNIIKNLNSKIIYNAIHHKFKPVDIRDKKKIVLTVGICNNLRGIKLKGIDFFLQTAKALPKYKFIVIGISDEVKKSIGEISENVLLLPKIPHEKLIYYYKQAKVYCQFSLVESFGLSVVEAIFYKCFPVVTRFGALPEIVGNDGLYLEELKIEKSVQLIENAFQSKFSKRARERVIHDFSYERREKELILTINNIIQN